ncbi:MAG: TetR/AcrR family transcriptional regulator [Myxococcales bacterium]
MARATSQRPAKHGYHHGDLRRALIEAAWRLVRKEGVEALTLREVARKVGVTHAAPYHHFASREALLDALAEEGFEALGKAMSGATQGISDPTERLFVLGRVYIDEAKAHPERLQVMFRRHPGPPSEEDAETHGARVFMQLFDAVVACQEAGVAPEGDPWDLALAAWSLVHGFSTLWVAGPLESMPHYAERFEVLRDTTLRGLGQAWRVARR